MSGATGGKGFTHETATGKSDEWWTPEWLFEAMYLRFTLDPCGHPAAPATQHCNTVYSRAGAADFDGLTMPWRGRVFLNPPYSDTASWVDKLLAEMLEPEGCTSAVTLTFARTGAKWAQVLLRESTTVLFLNQRVQFIPGDGQHASSPGADSMLCAWGQEEARSLRRMADAGFGVCR